MHLLKYLHNLSDERVVEFWSLSPYAQYFCGEEQMQWGPPCEASELTHFRKRIGPGGAEKIFSNLSPSRLGSLLGLIHRN